MALSDFVKTEEVVIPPERFGEFPWEKTWGHGGGAVYVRLELLHTHNSALVFNPGDGTLQRWVIPPSLASLIHDQAHEARQEVRKSLRGLLLGIKTLAGDL